MSGEYEAVTTVVEPEVTEETKTRRMPPYNVVVLNDEDHTFEYVIEMLIKLFAHTLPRAKELTWEIHSRGRAIVLHDAQGEGRAEARPGSGVWRRSPPEPVQELAAVLHRAGVMESFSGPPRRQVVGRSRVLRAAGVQVTLKHDLGGQLVAQSLALPSS